MKLELKHIAPYLPYVVRAKYFDVINVDNDCIIDIQVGNIFETGHLYNLLNGSDYMLILRPLSDLTKDLGIICSLFNWYYKKDNMTDVNLTSYYNSVKKYTWINYKYIIRHDNFSDRINGGSSFKHSEVFALPNMIMQELIEKHFDVFGLIDKGLAIDINTL